MAEQILILNLRRGFIKVPTWRKSKRAMDEIRKQIAHYTKAKEVTLSKYINEYVWAHGAKNPPPKIKLKLDVNKEKKTAKAELFELPEKAKRELEKQIKAEAAAKAVEKAAEKPVSETPTEAAAEAKPAEKEKPAGTKKEEPAKETKKKAPKLTRKQEIAMNQ